MSACSQKACVWPVAKDGLCEFHLKDALEQMPESYKEAKGLSDGIIADIAKAGRYMTDAAVKLHRFIAIEGWLALGFGCMTDWSHASFSVRTWDILRLVMKALHAGIAEKDLQEIPVTNLLTLMRSVPGNEAKKGEWIEKAKTLKSHVFRTVVRKEVGPQGRQARRDARDEWRNFTLPVSSSCLTVFLLAVERTGVKSRGEALEIMALHYLDTAEDKSSARAEITDKRCSVGEVGAGGFAEVAA